VHVVRKSRAPLGQVLRRHVTLGGSFRQGFEANPFQFPGNGFIHLAQQCH